MNIDVIFGDALLLEAHPSSYLNLPYKIYGRKIIIYSEIFNIIGVTGDPGWFWIEFLIKQGRYYIVSTSMNKHIELNSLPVIQHILFTYDKVLFKTEYILNTTIEPI